MVQPTRSKRYEAQARYVERQNYKLGEEVYNRKEAEKKDHARRFKQV